MSESEGMLTSMFKSAKKKLGSPVKSKVKFKRTETQADVQKNHLEKMKQNIGDFCDWYGEKYPKAKPVIPYLKPAIILLYTVFDIIKPFLQFAIDVIGHVYNILPQDMLYVFYGLSLCFFGGTFCCTIAAIEAFTQLGGNDLQNAKKDLLNEFAKFDKKRESLDSSSQIDEKMTPSELVSYYTKIFFLSCDPMIMNQAFAGTYKGLIGILAILRIGFARTVVLALSIAEMLQNPMKKFMFPVIEFLLPKLDENLSDEEKKEELKRRESWKELIVKWTLKITVFILSWFIAVIIRSVQSAVKGGLIMSRHLIKYMIDTGYIPKEKYSLREDNLDCEDSLIDETIGYTVAVAGILFQFYTNFSIMFPFNVFLFPLSILEYMLRWLTI